MPFDPTRSGYYVLHIWGDVEPTLHGPYPDWHTQTIEAQNIRRADREDPPGGMFRVKYDPKDGVSISVFSGDELDDEGLSTAREEASAELYAAMKTCIKAGVDPLDAAQEVIDQLRHDVEQEVQEQQL